MTINGINFDDWTKGDDGIWSQVCKSCAKTYSISKKLLSECSGEPICGVEGCNNTADYYIDFEEDKK